jgi:hypothetical protein
VSACEPEPAPGGYTENGVAVVKIGGNYTWVERLDPASDLPTLDAPAPYVPEPEGGWPEGTVMAEGRPVRPLNTRSRSRTPQWSRRPASATGSGRAPRRMTRPRERRERAASRAQPASRDGPSDSPEGDPELPRSPDAADDLERLPSAVLHARWATRRLR